MRGTDKFLLAIVAAIVLLVVAAFAVALTRPEPAYQVEDTPEGAAYNYLLAIEREEFERAYGYLSPTLPGYPASADEFAGDILKNRWAFNLNDGSSVSLVVDSSRVTGDRATVLIRETVFSREGLFSSPNESARTFALSFRQEGDAWKLASGEAYWLNCWEEAGGCSP